MMHTQCLGQVSAWLLQHSLQSTRVVLLVLYPNLPVLSTAHGAGWLTFGPSLPLADAFKAAYKQGASYGASHLPTLNCLL